MAGSSDFAALRHDFYGGQLAGDPQTQCEAIMHAYWSLCEDIDRGLDWWQQPEFEDGGRHPDPFSKPFTWNALCWRWEDAERLEHAFPVLFEPEHGIRRDRLQKLAEGC